MNTAKEKGFREFKWKRNGVHCVPPVCIVIDDVSINEFKVRCRQNTNEQWKLNVKATGKRKNADKWLPKAEDAIRKHFDCYTWKGSSAQVDLLSSSSSSQSQQSIEIRTKYIWFIHRQCWHPSKSICSKLHAIMPSRWYGNPYFSSMQVCAR